MRSVVTAVRLRRLVTVLATGHGEQGREDAPIADVDVDDLGAARGSGNKADGAAADTERLGRRGQRCLGCLAIHSPRAYTDDQGAVVLAADTGTRRARPHSDSDPHVYQYRRSITGQVGGGLVKLVSPGRWSHNRNRRYLQSGLGLAAGGLPVWVVSSYDGDLVLVPADRLDEACEVLQAAGHQVRGDRDAGSGRRTAS
jgi:hypothetical protein